MEPSSGASLSLNFRIISTLMIFLVAVLLSTWKRPETKQADFPVLWERISVWIVTPLVYFWLCVIVVRSDEYLNGEEIYATLATAFATTAALSGICFSLAQFDGPEQLHARRAGSKFLHSSLLLVQALLFLSLRHLILDSKIIESYPQVVKSLRGISHVLFSYVATAAVWAWHHGFTAINTILWRTWRDNVEGPRQES